MDPVIDVFKFFFFILTAYTTGNRYRSRNYCRRTSKPAFVTMEQLFHASIYLLGKKNFSGFEEIKKISDVPEAWVVRYPLRF